MTDFEAGLICLIAYADSDAFLSFWIDVQCTLEVLDFHSLNFRDFPPAALLKMRLFNTCGPLFHPLPLWTSTTAELHLDILSSYILFPSQRLIIAASQQRSIESSPRQ